MNLLPVCSFILRGRPTFMNLLRGEKTIQTVATCVKYSLNTMKNPRRYVSLMLCSLLADQPSRIQGVCVSMYSFNFITLNRRF